MNDLDARRINLNLLPALEALLETRSVTAAARRTHVSQSAMSHSLARLREVLGDPLLTPSGRDLVLTPRAARLAASLPGALDQLTAALSPGEPFEPATTRRTFRLATLDYFEVAVLEDLMAYLRAHAPYASVWIDRLSPATLPALLAGEVDLALVGEGLLPRLPALSRQELYRDPFAVMMRPEHPAAKKRKLSLATYLASPHVVVTVEGRADGAVDRALEAVGAKREVTLRLPHFATAPLAVLGSDALCTIASSIAERARALYGLATRTPPLELPSPAILAVWARRGADDEGARWFRSLFLEGKATSRHLRALASSPRRS
ncbi:MAG: LysR family transcriptional regulator [Sandaracinaceae bacterium]|nr:LysR family transcriptional regulator [Sandaracinaceae bacterium]